MNGDIDINALQRRFATDLDDHPRVIWPGDQTNVVVARIEADSMLKVISHRIRDAADRMLEFDPAQREKIGRRLLDVSRIVLMRVLYLSAVYRLTGEQKYSDRAAEEMRAAAGFSDWNPSHFLDVAEMTAGLAIGYDWLHDQLDEETRRIVRVAIVEKGLRTSFEHEGRWARATNNWGQVCHGGLTLGALAVAEHEPELAARIIARMSTGVRPSIGSYSPDGAYPEGPNYWYYGTSFNVILLDALGSTLGTSFGLVEMPGLLATADYFLHVTGTSGRYFGYSDGHSSPHPPTAAQAWFAARRNEPGLLYHQKDALARLESIDIENVRWRLLPFMLLWARSLENLPRPNELSYLGRGHTPVGLHRTAWNRDATYVGFKGGTPAASHGHMDIGQFVLDADGVRWSADLGSQSYHGIESRGMNLWDRSQDSDRWTIFRYNSLSHSTLVVDGKHQRVGGFAPIIRYQAMTAGKAAGKSSGGDGSGGESSGGDRSGGGLTAIDMTAVYEGQLATARRGVRLMADGRALVQDEVKALSDREGPTTVRWAIATPGDIETASDGGAVLREAGKMMRMQLLGLDHAPRWRTWSLEPPNEWDEENPGMQLVGFEIALDSDQAATFAVLFTPAGMESKPLPPLVPIENWPGSVDALQIFGRS